MLLLGKPVAEKILSETKAKIKASGIVPGLAVVLVGGDPASLIYVGIKELRAREIGMRFELRVFEKTAEEGEITDCIRELNGRSDIHGIIVQLPLPTGIDADNVIAVIDPAKDADGFLSTGKNYTSTHGRELMLQFLPVFPEAMIELAKSAGASLVGKTGIVLVNSQRFGRVMTDALAREGMEAQCILNSSELLSSLRATEGSVAIQGSDEENSGLPRRGLLAMTEIEKIRSADVVFTALGQSELLRRDMFKKGAVVIDGGIAEKDGKIVGDVSSEGSDADLFLSPVPGGVGPVTVACLLRRTTELALGKNLTER